MRTYPLVFAFVALAAIARPARADEPAPKHDDGGVHIRLGVRGAFIFRQNDGYFDHARVFVESPSTSTRGAHLIGDPIPPAGGFHFEAGAELLPRFSLMASFRTMTDGVKTGDDTRLSLTSTGWVLDARFAILRYKDDETPMFIAQLEPIVGLGRFGLTEQFVDRALFDGTKQHQATAIGGRFGVDASAFIGPVGLVLGYAYDVAPAKITDRLGGSISASGHELTFGLAARF